MRRVYGAYLHNGSVRLLYAPRPRRSLFRISSEPLGPLRGRQCIAVRASGTRDTICVRGPPDGRRRSMRLMVSIQALGVLSIPNVRFCSVLIVHAYCSWPAVTDDNEDGMTKAP
ncbi:hypothetical protein MRX96_014450 [Rhipicephalus microplus]